MRLFGSVFVCLLMCIPIVGQSFSVSQLKDIVWLRTSPNTGDVYKIKFTDKDMSTMKTYRLNGETRVWCEPYYMSDTRPSCFDSTLIGKSLEGKFGVVQSQGNIHTFRILGLTKYNLIIEFEVQKGFIGGNTIMKFKREE